MATRRLVVLGGALGLAWATLAARVFQIQVLRGGYYRALAAHQSLRRNVLSPQRGEIEDRDGVQLAVNVEGNGRVAQSFRGARLYPNGPLAGQILGVVGRDGYGESGLEFRLDRDLRGTDGWRLARYDARNRYAPGTEDRGRDPVNGLTVQLALDAKVQSITELALARGVVRSGAKDGVAIVVDPASGDVLAMANYPFFDPNTNARGGDENWKDRAVVKVYEPGSTFKIVTAGALLQEHAMAPDDTVDAEGGSYKIAGEIIRDTHPMYRLTFTQALAYSSNISFAKMSMRLKPIVFYKYIRSFGFGMKTGIDLPGEESGWLEPVEHWSARSQPTLAFGHEIAVTPLQMVMAAAAVANDGVLMRPRLVRAWRDLSGAVVRTEPARPVRRVLSDSTAAVLRAMLRAVVDYGTAKDIRHSYIPIAGKTGTAEIFDSAEGRYAEGRFNSSFVGMAPVDHPAFVALVLLDEPQQFKYGGQSGAPIFREILDRLAVEWDWMPQHPDHWAARRDSATNALSAGEVPLQRAAVSLPALDVDADVVDSAAAADTASDRTMPDLRNYSLRDVLRRMRAAGIEVEYDGEGRVVGQEPAPGTPLHRGMHCRVTLGWMG